MSLIMSIMLLDTYYDNFIESIDSDTFYDYEKLIDTEYFNLEYSEKTLIMMYYYIIRKIALGSYTNYKKIKYIKTFNNTDSKIIYNLLLHTYFGNSKSVKNKFTSRINDMHKLFKLVPNKISLFVKFLLDCHYIEINNLSYDIIYQNPEYCKDKIISKLIIMKTSISKDTILYKTNNLVSLINQQNPLQEPEIISLFEELAKFNKSTYLQYLYEKYNIYYKTISTLEAQNIFTQLLESIKLLVTEEGETNKRYIKYNNTKLVYMLMNIRNKIRDHMGLELKKLIDNYINENYLLIDNNIYTEHLILDIAYNIYIAQNNKEKVLEIGEKILDIYKKPDACIIFNLFVCYSSKEINNMKKANEIYMKYQNEILSYSKQNSRLYGTMLTLVLQAKEQIGELVTAKSIINFVTKLEEFKNIKTYELDIYEMLVRTIMRIEDKVLFLLGKNLAMQDDYDLTNDNRLIRDRHTKIALCTICGKDIEHNKMTLIECPQCQKLFGHYKCVMAYLEKYDKCPLCSYQFLGNKEKFSTV